jgi:hypothetical protein
MSYKPHPLFQSPEPVSRLWRYMDFAKLVSVLANKSLFFPSATKLLKDDQYEGLFILPKTSPSINPDLVDTMIALTGHTKEQVMSELSITMAQGWEFMKPVPPSVFINSWHMNDDESDAMWKIYARDMSQGVAIRTTFARLMECFSTTHYDIFIGAIKYIDYSSHEIDHGNAFNRFLHKRTAFAHEREVRAICQPMESFARMGQDGKVSDQESQRAKDFSDGTTRNKGLTVPIDVPTLIDAIVLSPASPSWFADAVKSAVSAFGFNTPIVWSAMQTLPPA